MLVLVGAGVGYAGVGVVDDGAALGVGLVEEFGFPAERAVLEGSELAAKVGVYGTGEDNVVVLLYPVFLVGEEIGFEVDADAGKELFEDGGVAPDGDALVAIGEVVIVEVEADEDAAGDGGRQLAGLAVPLLEGVAVEEGFVEFAAESGEAVLFHVLGIGVGDAVGGDLGLGFFGGAGSVYLMEGEEVDGERVEAVTVRDLHAVDVVVERGVAVDVVPDLGRISMEDVGAVDVFVAVGLFAVAGEAVAADVVSLFDYVAAVSGVG